MGTPIVSVAVVQTGGMSDDIAANVAAIVDLGRAAVTEIRLRGDDVDLLVLPELSTTPYFGASTSRDRSYWAEDIDGPTVRTFRAASRELHCAIAFGFFECVASGAMYNSFLVIDRTGKLVPWTSATGGSFTAYRKLALPSVSMGGVEIDEKRFFTPGAESAVFDLFGVRFGCAICYDRSFPENWLIARALGAQVMLVPVSSLGSRQHMFTAELRTRAMESQMWVAAANRGGDEVLDGDTVCYFGDSVVVDPSGEIVTQAPSNTAGEVIDAAMDIARVLSSRAGFALARDRRPDVIRMLSRLTDGQAEVTSPSSMESEIERTNR
nr:carbon-nitrogen hydrolase family protein [Rhodococcus sp. (in: high G+C Gram-positive bacteria)]